VADGAGGRQLDGAPLAPHTTLGLGGPAARLVTATTEEELLHTVGEADAAGTPLLILGGGSNVVLPDEGFPGTVVLVRTRGVSVSGTRVRAAAGEEWDALVHTCVAAGLAGVECLAGIPGRVGATPVQNVGAYGQEVSQTVTSVRVLDRRGGVVSLAPADCDFTYRSSVFKREPGRYVVLEVEFGLTAGGCSTPIRYAELARALDLEVGQRAPLAAVPPAVVALRRRKGMVVAGDDLDSRSVGSFFTNPVLSVPAYQKLVELAEAAGLGQPPHWPEGEGVKVSAAWLVQSAGFHPGYGKGPVRVSSKHALALTHRGDGTSGQLLSLAREVRDGVRERFGVEIIPEPVVVGAEL